MLNADGGCNSAVTARVRSAWKMFCEYLPILTGELFSIKLKGKVYAICVRSCLMYCSETWPMRVEHELKLNRTEMSMIRWMCGFLSWMKEIKVKNSENSYDWNQSVWWSKRVDWDSLDILNVKMIMTGWKEGGSREGRQGMEENGKERRGKEKGKSRVFVQW